MSDQLHSLLFEITFDCESCSNIIYGAFFERIFNLPSLGQLFIVFLYSSKRFYLVGHCWSSRWRFRHLRDINEVVNNGGSLVDLILSFRQHIAIVSGWVILARVVVRVKVLRFPICSHEASSILKLGRDILMLFFPLEFCFHPPSSLGPLIHGWFSFLVAPFLLQLSVLVLKPVLLHTLLIETIWGVVVEKRAAALKSILLHKLNFLRFLICQVYRIKSIKGLLSCRTFCFVEGTCRWYPCQRRVG